MIQSLRKNSLLCIMRYLLSLIRRSVIGGQLAEVLYMPIRQGSSRQLRWLWAPAISLLVQEGERWVASEDFFLAMNKTMIKPDELLTEIKIPVMDSKTGWAFEEVSRRHGDRVMMGRCSAGKS